MGQVSRSQEEAEMWDRYYWETIFHRSLVFIYILQAEALPAFVLDCLFKDACVENSLRRQTLYLSLSLSLSFSGAKRRFSVQYNKDNDSVQGKGQADLLRGYYKRFSFPNLGWVLLLYNATHCMGRPHLALFALPCGNRG